MRNTLRGNNMIIYRCWKGIKTRCNNPNCKQFHNYGGRGIKVCDDWAEFEPFYEWAISSGWREGLEIDRIDPNGDYCPENCRWITRAENLNNKRNTIWITANGERKTRTDWERELGIPYGAIKQWVQVKGMEYAIERINKVMAEGYDTSEHTRTHSPKPIVCVETGEEFFALRDAERKMNIGHGRISEVLRTGRATHGYHFVFADQ